MSLLGSNLKSQSRLAKTPLLLPILHNSNYYNNIDPSTFNPQTIYGRLASIAKAILISIIVILGLATLVICSFYIFMSISLVSNHQAPIIKIDSLFVSNFNVSKTRLSGNWDVKFTLWNPNFATNIYFDRVEGFILYKENALAINSLEEPFMLGINERKMMYLQISTTGLEGDQPTVKDWVLDGIENELRDQHGRVSFGVQMAVWATYKSAGWYWGSNVSQRYIMNPRCYNLNVGFFPRSQFGKWLGERPVTCMVPMLNDD